MTVTMLRCLSSFVVSILLSLFLGLLCGIFPTIDIFFSLTMNMIKVTPVVSFILLALFWFTSSKVPIFVSVLMSLPVMTTAISSGIRNSDKKLLQMTVTYNFTAFQKLRWFYIPSMLPYFAAGAITSLGLTWKVVIAGEILSLPKNAVGSLLQLAKVHIETTDVFAITGIVVFFSYFFEKLFSCLIWLLKNKFSPDETSDK
jgi:NitT/TauT family transport system permease protein